MIGGQSALGGIMGWWVISFSSGKPFRHSMWELFCEWCYKIRFLGNEGSRMNERARPGRPRMRPWAYQAHSAHYVHSVHWAHPALKAHSAVSKFNRPDDFHKENRSFLALSKQVTNGPSDQRTDGATDRPSKRCQDASKNSRFIRKQSNQLQLQSL